jgi:HK97 family phage prohead protease
VRVNLSERDLVAFARTYGSPGERERRTVPLTQARARTSGGGDGRLKISGHAAVFDTPSVEMRTSYGRFVEFIDRHAFDHVLTKQPDVLLTWDHSTTLPLARTSAGTLELSTNSHGLRYFASVTPTSYSDDLRNLMNDGVVSQSSFLFTVAPDGEQ